MMSANPLLKDDKVPDVRWGHPDLEVGAPFSTVLPTLFGPGQMQPEEQQSLTGNF